jgi:molybdate transport system substrate-binding protein
MPWPPRSPAGKTEVNPLHILSAGAAQSVTQRMSKQFTGDTGREVKAAFGAVGAMKARVVAGEPVDVVILSAPLIEELIASGLLVGGTRRDLGTVGTGVAVSAGTPPPDISSTRALRDNLLAAQRIVCPDPAIATAGKIVMRALEILGIGEEVRPKIQLFPNGYAAMASLAESRGPFEMGITQTTEILGNKGVTYAGPLPAELQMKTVYAAGLAANAQNPEAARDFIARLVAPAARSMLEAAGYEFA